MFYRRKALAGPARLRMFVRHHLNPLVTMVVILAAVCILALGAKARLTASGDQTIPPNAQRNNVPIPSNIQVETFRLGFNGFEPKEITRRPGPFVLGIDNYNFRNASFELVREDGNTAHEINWPTGKTRYRKLLNLPPGNYLLREVNHPDWTAQIIIGK